MQIHKSVACRTVTIALLLMPSAFAVPPHVSAISASLLGPAQAAGPCDGDTLACAGLPAIVAGAAFDAPSVPGFTVPGFTVPGFTVPGFTVPGFTVPVVPIPVPPAPLPVPPVPVVPVPVVPVPVVPVPVVPVPVVPVPVVPVPVVPVPVVPVPGPTVPGPGGTAPGRTEAEPPRGARPAPGGDGTMPAITVEGDQIMRDGEPWWFLGYNSFVWSGDCGHDDEKMSAEDVDRWFAGMRHDGHGAVRLWFFDGWDIERLDAAVASAREHNVYLTVTLDDAIGGCGENDKDAGWFADQSERDTFQNHMETLLERYRGETAFAWFEYFNEPDYVDGALREFYDEMGGIADSIDPSRLFSSGTVAPYWVDGEDNFRDIHESDGVDIASLHEYDMDEVESNHGPRVRANSAGKPVIVGEYGIEAGDGCDSFGSRAERFADKVQVYTDTGIGYAGALAWAWQPGGGDCDLENLDADTATQDVLRTFR